MKHNAIAVAVLVAAAVSCSPRHYAPVLQGYTDRVRVDSVYVLDSVYIDCIRTIQAKADTVYVTDVRTEYKYRYRDRVKTDTLVMVQTVTEVREVERELTGWQRFRLRAFWWLAGVIAVWIAWKSRRLWLYL